jgi:DNA-binding NarL/FixJ family response regulator
VRIFKILVVEDFELFRQFILSSLQRKPQYNIVGQASDGLEAVQLAEHLQPDLVLLDLGLPKLNGIEAAKKIRTAAPFAKILFVSIESSPEVIQAALRVGAMGYVAKTRAERDLLPAVEAVLAGGRFVSDGMEDCESSEGTTAPAPHRHEVQFYSEDEVLLEKFTRFIANALRADGAAIVIVTKSHQERLVQRLKLEGLDIDKAIQQGTYIFLDAADALRTIMVEGLPCRARFFEEINRLVESAFKAATAKFPRIAFCGERVGLLWAEGNTDAAILLEKFCNELSKTPAIDILCGYPLLADAAQGAAFKSICAEHSVVSVK